MFPLGPIPVGSRQSIVATGGTIGDIPGFRYHIFYGSGTFNVVSCLGPFPLEYLVVAGGAGGGHSNSAGASAGGGGAGGVRAGTLMINFGARGVVVGAGGNGNATEWGWGFVGGESNIQGIAAATGGGGGSPCVWEEGPGVYTGGRGNDGGCGGGTGYNNIGYGRGQGIAGQGYNGMEYNIGGYGGGGGGAGNAATSYEGGTGKVSTILGTSITVARGGNASATPASYYGDGGGGGIGSVSFAGYGGYQGIVIVRYPYP